MFDFFKKKAATPIQKAVLSAEEKEKLQGELNQALQKIKQLETADTVDQALLAENYETAGLCQSQLDKTDAAISSLEQSQILKNSIGTGYKQLMSLYNQKRAQAAQAGDDAGIDYWMKKMDEMRQIAKKVTISGQ